MPICWRITLCFSIKTSASSEIATSTAPDKVPFSHHASKISPFIQHPSLEHAKAKSKCHTLRSPGFHLIDHKIFSPHPLIYVSLIGSGEDRHTTHLLKCVLLLSISQTDWKQSSDILSDISSNISSDILSDISFDISFDFLSDILSNISFDILSDISVWHVFWHSFWHIFWYSFWHIFWHYSWHIFLTSLLTFFLTYLLTLFLTYLLTFFLTSLLTFFLTYLLTFFLTSFWHIFWHSFWHIFLTFLLTYLLSFFLTNFLTHYLRSGTPHWTPRIAVEVRHATLNS